MPKTFKRKNAKNTTGIVILILLSLFFYTLSTGSDSQGTSFHGTAGEMALESRILGNTLDLDWTPYSKADLYTIYYSDSPDNLVSPENIIEEAESFGLSLTPLREGYYLVSANIGSKTIESEVIEVIQ